MNEIIVEETGLPMKFPDPREEAFQRAQEFQRLSSSERFQEVVDIMAFGFAMVRRSPMRAEIRKKWDADEAEWQRLQQEILVKYGH